MFKYLEHKKKVGDNQIIKNNYYYVYNGKINEYYSKTEILELDEYFGVEFFDDFFHVFTNRSKSKFYDYNSNLIGDFDNVNFNLIISKSNYVYFDRIDRQIKYNSTKIEDGKIGISLKIENSLIFIKNNFLNKFDLINKNLIWELDLSILEYFFKLGDGEVPVEIFKFLGVLENHLIAVCTDSSILKIDVETGKIIKRFQIELFKNSTKEHIAQYNYIQLINNRLTYFKNGCFVEYDLIEEKIIIEFDISENLKNENLIDNAPDFVLENNLLYYFVSGFGSFSKPSLVILDINSQKIIWSFIYEYDNVTFREFKKNDRNLFALDSENVLHVFEKATKSQT